MVVLNIETRSTVNAAPPGFRNIVENTANPALNEWTPGDDPQVNDIWDGAIPAGFAPPAPPSDVPDDVPTAMTNLADAQAEVGRRTAQLATLLGTPS